MDRRLSPEVKREIRESAKDETVRYHLGIGMGIRNEWGLWGGSELARWFNAKGVSHPDAMSGIILTSYWRRVHGLPLDVEGQIRAVQADEADARKEARTEEVRADAARTAIRGMMLGVRESKRVPVTVRFAPLKNDSFRTRYAAPFLGGVLVTAKRFSAETIRRKPDHVVRTFFLDPRKRTLRPVQVAEGQAEDAVVLSGAAFVHVTSGGRSWVLRWDGRRRSFLPPPPFALARLGIERTVDGLATRLLGVGNHGVARWNGKAWETLRKASWTLPDLALPPEILGDRLVFRDEGRYEEDKGLSWISLKGTGGPVRFDEHIGLVGPSGPRWENVWDLARTGDGAWWIATGSLINRQSLLRWTKREGYRVAIYNDATTWSPDFLAFQDSREDPKGLAMTALAARPDGGLDAIGPHGFFTLQGGEIERHFQFVQTPKDWIPSRLLRLGPDRWLLGGHFGGLFLMEKGAGGFTATGWDDRTGPPLRW